jgi:RNA polymerase sigma-70 factor, ECF subfamily
MSFTELDQQLLQRCFKRKPGAWKDFVRRFLGLVIYVANHTAQTSGIRLTPDDQGDLCAEVMSNLIENDFAILRRFRRQSSLATYLTVIARRIVVRQLAIKRQPHAPTEHTLAQRAPPMLTRVQGRGTGSSIFWSPISRSSHCPTKR